MVVSVGHQGEAGGRCWGAGLGVHGAEVVFKAMRLARMYISPKRVILFHSYLCALQKKAPNIFVTQAFQSIKTCSVQIQLGKRIELQVNNAEYFKSWTSFLNTQRQGIYELCHLSAHPLKDPFPWKWDSIPKPLLPTHHPFGHEFIIFSDGSYALCWRPAWKRPTVLPRRC